MEDEFTACIDPTVPVVTLPQGQTTLQLDITINQGDTFPLLNPLPAPEFPTLALKLSHLVAGPAAVVGVVETTPDDEGRLISLRVLPTGRPWIMPGVPDWVKNYTGKSHTWQEHEPKLLIDSVIEQLRRFNQSASARGLLSRRTLYLLADMSLADAEASVNAMDNDLRNPMKPHRKHTERLKRYYAPLRPLARLWDLDGVRLWRGEAGNAHQLNLARFNTFFEFAENVLGRGSAI